MGNRKPTIKEVKDKLKTINPNIEIIDNEYKNKDAKLKCKCLIDDHEWYGRWGHLKKGIGCPKCAGKIITIEDIRNKLKIINPNIQMLSDEYKHSKTKLKLKCLIDKYEWETTWDVLKQGHGCPKCGILKNANKLRFPLEKIKEKLKAINPNIEIVSDEYFNGKARLKCKCLINNCEYEWETTWDSLRQGHGCPKCGALKISDKLSLSLKDVKEKIKKINSDIIILSDEYHNNSEKLKCKCKVCGYEWSTSWNAVSSGTSCRKCFIEKRRFTLEEIKKKLKNINPDIEILSSKYINSKSKLLVKCLIDGYEWETIWSELQQGYGCLKCAIANRSGQNSYRWKGGISELREYLRGKITEWKNQSMKNCNYKCAITGKPFNEIHHTYSFDLILKEVLQITKLPLYEKINKYNNEQLKLLESTCMKLHYKYGLGICVTKEIHSKFHEIYGFGNNTPKQWEEFKKNRIRV